MSRRLVRLDSFFKLADEVNGFEKPGRGGMADLAALYRHLNRPLPESLADGDRHEFRLLEPKRTVAEKLFLSLAQPLNWEKWFSWAKEGEIQIGDVKCIAYSDRKVTLVATGLVGVFSFSVLVLPMVLIPQDQLGPVARISIAVVMLASFGSALILLEGTLMHMIAFATLLGAFLQGSARA